MPPERNRSSEDRPEAAEFLRFVAYVFNGAGDQPRPELVDKPPRVARKRPEQARNRGRRNNRRGKSARF